MDARRVLVAAGILGCVGCMGGLGGLGCERARGPTIVVAVPRGVEDGVSLAVADLIADLEQVTGERPALRTLPAGACRDHRTTIVVLGHTHEASGEPRASDLPAQSYAIHEERCGEEGRRVILRGADPQASQWAIYDLAQRLGIRYFHPESTYYPESLEWPAQSLAVTTAPAFRRRSLHAHRKHPIELSPPRGDERSPAMAAIQRRWIDWNVKMRQTEVDGWDPELVGDYAYRRGFGRVASLSLLGTQQGGRPILDPDDPRPEHRQIQDAIDRALAPVAGAPPARRLEVQFGSSEFTELDPTRTLARLALVTADVGARYPEVAVEAINHGTHGEPLPPHGVRFFDLPGLAPPALGVQVHPLMFYDLERSAAGVYGNPSYQGLLRFIRAQAPIRRIVHYPESSWWLTFDLPVPLYLAPVTLDARAHDIALLRPLLADEDDAAAGVIGHHTFTSGQEWGYWLIDYCVAQMTWDPAIDDEACVDDVTAQMAAGEVIREVLGAVARRQQRDLRDPEILRLLVGSDDETEAGAAIGIHVHPLPPRPEAVLAWDDAAIAALEARGLRPLRAMAADYHAWADRVASVLAAQSPAQRPWVEEIVDGLRVFALRAEHAAAIYEAVIELRAARRGAAGQRAAAEAALERARALTEAARAVIRRREAAYRYPPELTIAGDERGTPGAVANHTVYPFRVLSRTHRLFYWERPDRQVAALLAADDEASWVRAGAAIVRQGAPLRLTVASDAVRLRAVEWGDGAREAAVPAHLYPAQGVYRWTARGRRGGTELRRSGEVAVVERRLVFPRGSIRVSEPPSAALLDGILPGIEVGIGDDDEPFLVVAEAADDGAPGGGEGALARLARSGDRSVPGELRLTLRGLGELVIADAVLEVEREPGGGGTSEDAEVRRLCVAGSLVTDNLVELLLASGGFEVEGARAFLAERLGVTVATLPPKVPLVAVAEGREGDG